MGEAAILPDGRGVGKAEAVVAEPHSRGQPRVQIRMQNVVRHVDEHGLRAPTRPATSTAWSTVKWVGWRRYRSMSRTRVRTPWRWQDAGGMALTSVQ